MADLDALRRACLALPEAVEVNAPKWEPTWTVRNKGFAYAWKGGALLRLGRHRVEFLIEAMPESVRRFSLPGGNWAQIDIAGLDEAALADLVREAWATVAPATLRRQLETL